MSEKLSEREREVLGGLEYEARQFALGHRTRDYSRPMDVGGSNSSHHSKTLTKLSERGLVEKKRWAGHCRRSYRYKITSEGLRLLSAGVVEEVERG